MSDTMGMPGQPGQQPTEEELRAYLMELRQADPAEFLMQAVNILVTGAQAKIGLPDGRLLIDAVAALVQAAGERVPTELGEALAKAVTQLQTAQVQAERELAASPGQRPPGDGEGGAAPDSGGGPTMSEPRQKMTDRLWVPGKGAPPVA